jgi:Uma2 family endonuclease
MRITLPPAGGTLVVEKVPRAEFLTFLEDLGDNRGSRVAYDRGRLEIVCPSPLQESVKSLLGRFVEVLSEELDIEICAAGSTTLVRKDIARGVESDECFFIRHEARVRGRHDLDLSRDPPPDLAIEVDVTRKSLDRFSIYAVIGVPEVWRHEGGRVEACALRDGEYELVRESLSFPGLAVAELTRFLELRATMGDTAIARRFRAWVREWSRSRRP